jgi:hypothetical protein
MEREILMKILELVNKGHKVAFEEDWGGNSITVFIDDSHTHCGIPEGSFDSLVKSLHETLVGAVAYLLYNAYTYQRNRAPEVAGNIKMRNKGG